MSKLLTRFFAFLFSFLFTQGANAQIINDDVVLNTQAQVDGFAATEVNGKITVTGAAITNLNGLSELTKCHSLIISSNASLTSIIGLANLESVKDDLIIRNNASLSTLVGFSSLITVGTAAPDALVIENNDNLLNVDGFLGLTFAHSLKIDGNNKLADLDGLSVLVEVDDFFIISNNPALTNLDGLSSFTTVSSAGGNLTIDNNDALTNVDGLSSVTGLAGLVIKNNAAITNLDGLSNLDFTVFGGITIENNAALTNVDGLSNAGTTGDLKIINNPSLANVDGLSGIVVINAIDARHSLIIKDNSSLTNLDGLSNLTRVGDGNLEINNNDALTNINGLSKLELVGQALIIWGNANLTNIDGLSNLEAVNGLNIQSNQNLTNLDGLAALLLVINGVDIRFNASLTDFCGLSNLFENGEIGGAVTIRNNGANTVSITPPPDITLNNDPGLCTKDISAVAPYVATVTGCLNPAPPSRSDYPPGNIFPVGTTNIIWSVTDGVGNTATAVQKVIISDNEVPAITQFPQDITVVCADDVPAASISSVTATDNCSVVVSHASDAVSNSTCANRFTLTRTYKATDGSGNTAARSQVITVNDNVAPQITGLSTSKQILAPPNHKMQDITVNYNVIDNCNSSPNHSFNVVSSEPVNGTGDGDTAPDWEIINDHSIKLRAERAASGDGRIYTIIITANDGCNATVTSTAQVVVAHNITGPHSGQSFRAGSTVSFTGEFWDVPANKHTAKWLIDGNTTVKATVTEPSGNKNGKVSGSYKFSSPGVYKLQMNVTDQNGVTTYANANGDVDAIVVIYDPNGGHTYGGGYFESPAGALLSDATATGKATYGFAMNYFKNSTYPKGETQFQFKVGDFEFNALNFDYLVITNSMAQFKGTGKIIGGQSGIGFTMTVVDGQLDGSGIDKIRIKVYNKNTGEVYYDNEPGASDASLPEQPVGTNSTIVISGVNSSLTKSNTANQNAAKEAIDQKVSPVFNVTAYPNPSANNFSLNVQAPAKAKVTMQVTDMYGRIIEVRNVTANSIVRFGDRYASGTYFVRVIQGRQHKELKLVKLPD
jgi:hypothetical protein